jgi:hypothetical protein
MQFVADSKPRLAAACRGAVADTGVGVLRVDLPSVGSDPEDPRMPGRASRGARASGNAQEIPTGRGTGRRLNHPCRPPDQPLRRRPTGQHRSSVRDPAGQAEIIVDI